MKQSDKTICLKKGEISVYSFGEITLYAYKSNDCLEDEVFILEKNGQAVILESPCFYENIEELKNYLEEQKWQISGILLSYHMAGASFLPQVKTYATKEAEAYGQRGGGAALIQSFANTFGDAFDAGVYTITEYLNPGKVTVGGIDFVIKPNHEAYDIEIPEIHAVYTHMLGHDCHSIVTSAAHADAMIDELYSYLEKGYALILTSHYTPEHLKDVETKIAYLKELKLLAGEAADAEELKAAVKAKYPGYSGDSYLDMTAGFFFGS